MHGCPGYYIEEGSGALPVHVLFFSTEILWNMNIHEV